MAEHLLLEKRDGIATITINRPEVRNVLTGEMYQGLARHMYELDGDDEVSVIVIRGAGEKAFCSGQDLKENAGLERSLKESLQKSYNPMIRRIRTMEKPVVGMINGVAAGAGCSLALACDMRVMASTAKLIEVFVRIALVPDSGSHWFLPRLAGMARAFEYAATGRDIGAEEALRVGLVNTVAEPAALERETMALAASLAKGPTRTIGLIKRALNKAAVSDLDTLLAYEAQIQQIAAQTEDHREGVTAFLEKRPPLFQGR